MSLSPLELRTQIDAALSEVTIAEGKLGDTLSALQTGGLRAEKVAVTGDVTDAFTRLRKARETLERLRDTVAV